MQDRCAAALEPVNDSPQSMQEKRKEEHCHEWDGTLAFFNVAWHSSHTKDGMTAHTQTRSHAQQMKIPSAAVEAAL